MTRLYRPAMRDAAVAIGPDLLRSVLTTGSGYAVAPEITEGEWDDDVVELLAEAASELAMACQAMLRRRRPT